MTMQGSEGFPLNGSGSAVLIHSCDLHRLIEEYAGAPASITGPRALQFAMTLIHPSNRRFAVSEEGAARILVTLKDQLEPRLFESLGLTVEFPGHSRIDTDIGLTRIRLRLGTAELLVVIDEEHPRIIDLRQFRRSRRGVDAVTEVLVEA